MLPILGYFYYNMSFPVYRLLFYNCKSSTTVRLQVLAKRIRYLGLNLDFLLYKIIHMTKKIILTRLLKEKIKNHCITKPKKKINKLFGRNSMKNLARDWGVLFFGCFFQVKNKKLMYSALLRQDRISYLISPYTV